MKKSTVELRNPLDLMHLVNNGHVQSGRGRLITFIALGGVFIDAYDFSSLGIGAVQLKQQLHLASWQLGLVSSAMAFSAFFGALFGGYFVDKMGRLKMFLLDLYFFVISALGAALSTNLAMLIVFRLMMGIGAGLDFPVALSFVAEHSPQSSRGRFVNLSYTNWYLAAIAGYMFSYLVYRMGVGTDLWRFTVGFGAVPALIILTLRFRYMAESPMWAAQRGDVQTVKDVLSKTYGVDVVMKTKGSAQSPPSYTIRDYLRIFAPPYRQRTILASVIAFTQSIEYFAVIFYLPIIAQMLFGQKLLYSILGSMFFSIFGLIGAFFQAWICDRTGIRRLALIGYVTVVVALASIGIAHQAGSLMVSAAFVAVFLLGHAFGPGPQGMAMGTLSFPTMLRGSAVGWTQAMLRVGSILGSFAFPLLLSTLGFSKTFFAIAMAPLFGLIVTALIRWEPIGKDIENEWLNRTNKMASPVNGGLEASTEIYGFFQRDLTD